MWSRDGRVDEEFSGDKIGSGSALVTFVGDTVASHGKACAMWFIFLWSVVANNSTVCGTLVTRHLLPVNEKTSVGALDVTDALEETTEFVCEAGLPSGAMNVGFDKVTIFEDVASDVVNDGSDEILRVGRGRGPIPSVLWRRARVAAMYPGVGCDGVGCEPIAGFSVSVMIALMRWMRR